MTSIINEYFYTMGQGTLTIYSASAGSGKTFQLAKVYLTHLFRSRYNYRKILAVTFTNKATAEMKSRILGQLYCLANGEKSEYLEDLIKDTGKSEEKIRNEAAELLFSILHDFSRFNISTIDSFFQKIIRSFARETGLNSGFNIELDHTIILSAGIDEMIASSAVDPEIKGWLTEYVMRNLEEEKSWNLKAEITKLAEELFREKFKILSKTEREKLEDKSFLRNYIRKISTIITSIENKIQYFGKELEEIYNRFELTDDMFYQKSRGIPGFIKSLIDGKISMPNNNVKLILDDNPRWSTKDPSPKLLNAIRNGLQKILEEAILFCEENFVVHNTAKAISSNIYALGILSDVLNKVHKVASDENTFLLSDAGELLSLITGEDQTPFIYEKTGNAFENFMIDEFQDTSFLQWKNFYPLISESMGKGEDNLIVGDIKQSIYRWRNSDWKILSDLRNNHVDNKRIFSKPLDKNWRSRSEIIRFNNTLFSVIPVQVDKSFSDDGFQSGFTDIYDGAVQIDPGKSKGGFVRLEFVNEEKSESEKLSDEGSDKINMKWEDSVLDKIPHVIELFQDNGYRASDIGIIVREIKEGEAVVKRMIDYSNNCPHANKERYNYRVVSDDSLTLSSSHVITFIIAVLKVLCDPEDIISRAQMLRFYLLLQGYDDAGNIGLYRERLLNGCRGYFPEQSDQFFNNLHNRPLHEVTESIISFFDLGRYPGNVAYLDTFQDQVLDYSRNKSPDVCSFVEWWETTGCKKSISLPSNQNAARILTIHKAKGLEFKVVILPFLSWNLDYISGKQPILWIKPDTPPFNELGIVPVRYGKSLSDTLFADDYYIEKYYSYVDNINLLYVAMTRAKDAIYGFVPEDGGKSTIAGILHEAVISCENPAGSRGMILKDHYDSAKRVFEYGEIPGTDEIYIENEVIISENYPVNSRPESLKLKLHGSDFFSKSMEAAARKINYGNLMHEVFEGITTADDIPRAIRQLINEGKIPEAEYSLLEKKLKTLIGSEQISEWFAPGINILKETEILTPSGIIRRPDRVILREDKTIVIDFKFGEENPVYIDQAEQYKNLLGQMGYKNIEACLWYVDKNKIVNV